MAKDLTLREIEELPIGAVILSRKRAWTRLTPSASQYLMYPDRVTWGCADGGFVREGDSPTILLPAAVLWTPEEDHR